MPKKPSMTIKEAIEQGDRGLAPLRERLGAEAGRTLETLVHRARRLADAAPDAPVPDAAIGLLVAVLADHEAELQRLLARVAWLEDERDYENAMRRALAPTDPAYAVGGSRVPE